MTIEQIFKIISPLITLIFGTILKYYLEEKSKLVSFLGHISAFTLQDEQKTQVYAHSIIVRNAGRKAARNVRLGHIYLPPHITIYPKVQHSIERNLDGSGEIVIPVLVPKEQITISYLYFPPVTWDQINNYTKSDEGLAKIVNVIPVPQPSRLLTFIIWFLMFTGASFLLYWLMKLIVKII